MAELYANGAKIIEKILRKQGCPKSLVLNNKDVKNKKKLYALVCEALKCKRMAKYANKFRLLFMTTVSDSHSDE